MKFNLKDLAEHGISTIAPSDPTFTNGKTVTIDPYSVLLKNTSSRAVVGYSIKWECFDGKNESANRDMSYDYKLSRILGVVFLYGEETERTNVLSRLEGVIKPNSTWLISYNFPARPIGGAVEEASPELDEVGLAQVRAACPTMTVTVDGVFFDDGTFVGPDTRGFFARVETQMAMRHEVLERVQSELKSGKTPTEVFQGLERIVNSESAGPSGEKTELDETRSEFRKLFARDVLGMKNLWGIDKAIEKVQLQLNRPWVKLRKIED